MSFEQRQIIVNESYAQKDKKKTLAKGKAKINYDASIYKKTLACNKDKKQLC